jgi:hypothetical protein
LSNKVNANPNLVIDSLTNQVAILSKEKAFYYALALENQEKVKELEKELEQFKNGNQES